MKYIIGYLVIGFIISLLCRKENDRMIWGEPALVLFVICFWSLLVIYWWSVVKVIRWNGKVIWRRT